MKRPGGGKEDPKQLRIEWSGSPPGPAAEVNAVPAETHSNSSVYAVAEVPPPLAGEKRETGFRRRRSHPREGKRSRATLPVPEPLPAAITAGNFGHDDNGPIRPSPREVREITETHALKLTDLLHAMDADPSRAIAPRDDLLAEFRRAIDVYAEDFGKHAADRLEAYVRRQHRIDEGSSVLRSRGR